MGLLSCCIAVHAESQLQVLINMLHKNGMISDAQLVQLQAALDQKKMQPRWEKQQTKVQMQTSQTAPAKQPIVSIDNGLKIHTQDKAFSFKLGGRVQADAATYYGHPVTGDGTEIRRARMYIQGRMYRDWGYKLQYDFANTGQHGKGIADAFVSYNGFKGIQLKLGHFKDPFSLQDQTSSKYILLTERALPESFSAGRHIGVMFSKAYQDGTVAGGLFGDKLNKTNGTQHRQNEGWGAGVRATFTPVNKKTQLVHLGLSLNYRDTGGSGAISFKQQAETHIAGINIVDTGTLRHVKDVFKTDAEIALVKGSVSVQGEYITTMVNRNGMKDLNFNGWYTQIGYFLTGELHAYHQGHFGGVVPRHALGEGGIGAWELGVRYSRLNLTDGGVNGGRTSSMTWGVNWYPEPTLRFSANYVDVLGINGGPYHGLSPSIFQIRSQWAF